MFLHMARVFLFGAYKYPRELNWIVGVLLLPLGDAGGLRRLPAALGPDLLLGHRRRHQPERHGRRSSGRSSRWFLQGGAEIGANTLTIFYALHMLLMPGAIIGLILLHLYLVVRLGVSSPPWSDEAAGRDAPRRRAPNGRAGLVNPAPRSGTDEVSRVADERRAQARALQGGRRDARGSRSSPTRCSTTRS